jgi:hypothetical protein
MAERRNGSTRRHRVWAARVLRDATVCALCGEPLDKALKWPDPMSPSADHIETWASNPARRYDITNGQASHAICNQRRNNRPMTDLAPPPSRQW